jgi:hypothetical protein
VHVGERFVVWAQLLHSELGTFAITRPGLDVLCRVFTTGDGGGPAEVLFGVAVGRYAVVTHSETGCRRCAVLGFAADIRVTNSAATAASDPASHTGSK